MIALLLVAGLFIYLSVVGQALVALIKPRVGVLWSWFVAPTMGLAVVIVIITRLNVWGIPIAHAGPWLTAGLLIAAAAILAWRRPKFPWRQLSPYFLIALGFLIYVGWPALRFGFNWISYGNDDMANYCLAAERFLHHGYYDIPLQTDLEGRDYAQHYWFMHALQQIRPGSELTVAWIASLTGRRAHEVFMPAILLLSLLQLFGLGAVAVWRGRYRKQALLGVFLLATSPLFALGTLYQLIAQVGGIALLLVAASMLFTGRRLTFRTALVGGILTACLAIFYPEVSPFVALGILLVGIRYRYTDSPLFKRYSYFILGVAALTFLLIASNTYEFINTLVMQSVGSAGLGAMAEINDQSGGLVLFPWTLVPSFIPMLFGLHMFGVVGVDPLISIQIIVGCLFLIYFLVRVGKNLRLGAPSGYLGVVMCVLGFYLFFKGQDFGLFKLAMFAQPVITLAVGQAFAYFLFSASPVVRQRTRIALVVFVICTVPSQVYYTYASLGTYGGGLTEVVKGSQLGVEFTPPKNLKYQGIESDISNVVTAKMLAQYTEGIDTRFLSRSYMDNIANIAVLKFLRTPDPDLGPQARIIEKLSLLRFMLPKELMKEDVPDYKVITIQKLDNNWTETSSRHLDYNDRLFVSVRTDLDHFNKLNPGTGWTVDNMYQYKLESQVKDRLVFVHSELSPHYYSSARFKAAFFQREGEPITHKLSYFHGTGRWTLFHVIHPSPNLRMIVDFSRTSLGEGRSELPRKAVVIGYDDYHLPFIGRGSARVVSPILKPEYFEGEAYLTVDFNDKPAPINKPKTGLMRWYGQKFALDDRRLVGFTRDISVITDEEYQALPRPTKIGNFPWDLINYPGLEYSGIYEDGWIGEDAFVRMGPSKSGQVLYFKGYIPDIPRFRTQGVDVTLSINGRPTEIVNLKAGAFTLTRLIQETSSATTITLHFSDAQIYDNDKDKRVVSAFVHEISINDFPDLASFRRLSNESGIRFDLEGVDEDGWIGKTAEFKSPEFDTFKVLKIDLENPGWSPFPANTLKVLVDGKLAQTDRVPRQSYQSVYVPLAPGMGHQLQLESSAVIPLPGEKRERSFAIKNISFENLSPTDVFVRGWHRSGYLFHITGADSDGWVDRRLGLSFPATDRFKTAIVEVIRYPARSDLPLAVSVDGRSAAAPSLKLEQTERIVIPLSAVRETEAHLVTDRSFTLSAADPRSRSYRVVNIDFQ
jgi:hypothetical protein